MSTVNETTTMSTTTRTRDGADDSIVRPLREADLPEADRIMRVAFGTFLGLPEPASFMGDADYVRTRWKADPTAAFAAELDGRLAGTNFATRWGSVGFFGPLTIRPDLWDRGLGRSLMEPVMRRFAEWDVAHVGLFTFAHSTKHVGLYQRFGFRPRFLTSIMAKPVGPAGAAAPGGDAASWTTFSRLSAAERATALDESRQLLDAILGGLDVTREIVAVAEQSLGETLLLREDGGLVALAVCHAGPGTEAGSGTCYVKFGAVRPGRDAARHFDRLLAKCEAWAAQRGLGRMVAGVNTARHEAYGAMLAHGFRAQVQGVAMHRPDDAGYSRPSVFVIDDWR